LFVGGAGKVDVVALFGRDGELDSTFQPPAARAERDSPIEPLSLVRDLWLSLGGVAEGEVHLRLVLKVRRQDLGCRPNRFNRDLASNLFIF
jgi:hypothetical protein